MAPKNSQDLAASVRARLLNIAKAEQTDFNAVLVRYALERFLYRLGQSAHADHFVLKGAMLFNLWYAMPQPKQLMRISTVVLYWLRTPAPTLNPLPSAPFWPGL